MAGSTWGGLGAPQQQRQPLADPPSPDTSTDPKNSAFYNVTFTSSRSSTVRTLDRRTSWAPCRNSIKASAPPSKKPPLLSTDFYLVLQCHKQQTTLCLFSLSRFILVGVTILALQQQLSQFRHVLHMQLHVLTDGFICNSVTLNKFHPFSCCLQDYMCCHSKSLSLQSISLSTTICRHSQQSGVTEHPGLCCFSFLLFLCSGLHLEFVTIIKHRFNWTSPWF